MRCRVLRSPLCSTQATYVFFQHNYFFDEFWNFLTLCPLIVGVGPVGLYTAISLARYGYRRVVLERKTTHQEQPKAHAINSETMETFWQNDILFWK